MKKLIIVGFLVFGLVGCMATKQTKMPSPAPQEVRLVIEGVENVQVRTEESSIQRMMEVPSPELTLSRDTHIKNGVAYMSVNIDGYRLETLWKDIQLLREMEITHVKIFMCSGGGAAMIGMAMTDMIDKMSDEGIHVTIEAAGIVASAAVSVFLAGDYRIAHENTIFLIHPATLFKWMAAEQLDDLKSQEEMLTLSRDLYVNFLLKRSTLTKEQAEKLIARDSWFSVQQAKEWGMVDEIR